MRLRDYQIDSANRVWSWFAEGGGHGLWVLPTGAGKSLIIAEIVRRVIAPDQGDRILMLTHSRELISQNLEKLLAIWPSAPAGVYAASLRRREAYMPIVYASIQTVHNKAQELGRFSLIIVDEAHLIPTKGQTMYRRFINDALAINPRLKIIGLSATPYRLDSGLLHTGKDALFSGIAYDLPIGDLIDRGYLVPLHSKGTLRQINLSGVRTRLGEYVASDLDRAVHEDGLTAAAVSEILEWGADRKAWLVFCSSVAHAYEIRDELRARGITAETVEADTPHAERDEILERFRAGEIRALTNMSVLTTGFDAPIVDMLVMLRPTQSTSLYVQMAGRGMRPAPGKTDCLVLDFAGNVLRHGPVDAVRPRDKTPGDGSGQAPQGKKCPQCSTISHASVRQCPVCEYLWPAPPRHEATATEAAILSSQIRPEWMAVTDVIYRRHRKIGKPDSLRVDYVCGLRLITEYVCLEHIGYARTKALQWLAMVDMTDGRIKTVGDAIRLSHLLRRPAEILVRREGKYDRIVNHRFVAKAPGTDTGSHAAA